MRRLGRILLAFAMRALAISVLLGIAAVATFIAASSALPNLQSDAQVEELLRARIESARALQAHRTQQKPKPFVVNDALFTAPAGNALLAMRGCSGVEGASPESPSAFRFRMAKRLLGIRGSVGSGRCELMMAETIVSALALELTRGQRLLAAWRIHQALPLSRLLAVWGSTYEFSSAGPFGLDEAAETLFGKAATKLDWNEAATLALATDSYDDVETCRYPPKLQSLRDPLLQRLAIDYPADSNAILATLIAKLPCERPPPPMGFAKPR